MVIDRDRQPMSDARRWRWLSLGSLAVTLLGAAVLAGSLLPPPASVLEATASPVLHTMPSAGEGAIVPGPALHPGPEAATLAGGLSPDSAPAVLRAVAVPIAATTPSGSAPAGVDE